MADQSRFHRAREGEERRNSQQYNPGGSNMGRGHWGMEARLRKLKMSIFEGEDAQGCIYQVERYFAINGLSEEERLMAAGLCLEGKALAWFQWREAHYPMYCWEEFKDCLLERFRAIRDVDLHEQFYALTQEGTVMEYREWLELLSGRLRGISEEGLEGNFMKGLKAEIREELRVLRPRELRKTMELAQMVEEKTQKGKISRNSTMGEAYRSPSTTLAPRVQTVAFQREVQQKKGTEVRLGGNFKRLTEAELRDRRAKGLCFRCNENYAPGHKCKDRALQVLLVCDGDKDGEG